MASQVQLRTVSLTDVRKLASLTNEVFSRDPGTTYLYDYPSEEENPDEFRQMVKRTLKRRQASTLRQICSQSNYSIGAFVDGRLAGFAIWSPPQSARPPQSPALYILSELIRLYDAITSYLRLLLREEEELQFRRQQLSKMDEGVKQLHVPLDFVARSHWTLLALGVLPKYERRGIATQLLKWGITRTDKRNEAIYVVASEAGRQLYSKHGFVLVHQERAVLPSFLDEPPGAAKREGGRAHAFTQNYLVRQPHFRENYTLIGQ